jgi:hypothetical protein
MGDYANDIVNSGLDREFCSGDMTAGTALTGVATATIGAERIIPEATSRSWFVILFTCIAGYLYFLGSTGLPVAHDSFDANSIRDTGAMMPYLLNQPHPLVAIFKAAVVHVEGPLQFLLLNAYCFTVGALLPLTPATMQFPNTIFAAVSVGFVFLIVRQFFSARTAFLCATIFALGPWLGITIRKAWYFNTLSCMLHGSTLYFFIRHISAPQEKFYKIAAPISLGLYIMTGLDWPCFLPSLALFLFLSFSRSGESLKPYLKRNAGYLVPVLSASVFIAASIIMTLRHGTLGFNWSRLGHPFVVFVWSFKMNSFAAIVENTLAPWGPQILLAFAGLLLYLAVIRKRPGLESTKIAFLDSVSVWLVVASAATIASSGDATYLYVLALPAAILSGLALSRLSNANMVIALVVPALFQVYVVTDKTLSFNFDKKQRVLAVACFLNEERPDLLSVGAAPVVCGTDALSVVSYMRARTISSVVPLTAANLESGPYGSHLFDVEIVKSAAQNGAVRPWFLIDTRALSDESESRDLWLRILDDPDVRWLGRFKDEGESEIMIGEFRKGAGVPLSQAPFLDVDALAATYLQKYDKIDFLGRNVEFIYHY